VKRDTALAGLACSKGAKAPSSLRSAGALQMAILPDCALLRHLAGAP